MGAWRHPRRRTVLPKTDGLADLAIDLVRIDDRILDVGDSSIDAREADGEDHTWLCDAHVVRLEHDLTDLRERVVGDQCLAHGSAVWSAESSERNGESGGRCGKCKKVRRTERGGEDGEVLSFNGLVFMNG